MMTIDISGIKFICQFEGFSPKAVKALPTEKYYTIGYGHYGVDVKKDMTISKKDAMELMRRDLRGFCAKVNKYNDIYNFAQNEFNALVSFCYNVGNIDQLTAYGKRSKKEIAAKMLLYNKSGGKVIRGLTKRRKKERALFLKK